MTAFVLAWSLIVLLGFGGLLRYSMIPGRAGPQGNIWPARTTLPRAPDRAALVMFLHPHCPCSRASLEELNRLLARGGAGADVTVVFVRPESCDEAWVHTDLWDTAAAIPNVRVTTDAGGGEARRFGALTSGAVFVYDKAGRLVFRGGITAARGHAGDNAGARNALLGLLGRHVDQSHLPVFGCSLSCNPVSPQGVFA